MAQKRPMLLLIDAGNTRIKWACIAIESESQLQTKLPANWEVLGSCSHQDLAQLIASVRPYLIERCLISNVAGDSLQSLVVQQLHSAFPALRIDRFTSQEQCAGVQNLYREAHKLGSDRFASAIAAHRQFPATPLIVATCGTATTVDAVTAEGHFLGGMILPGLQIMASALAKNTAQLPQIAESAELSQLFADNTDQAIASGCIHAQLGAILCAIQNLKQHAGNKSSQPVHLILSGGAATYLLPQLKQMELSHWHHVENLVLSGLWLAAHASPSATH